MDVYVHNSGCGYDVRSTLSCGEVGHHLHDFNLSIVLVGVDMTTVINKVMQQLTR